MRASNPTTAFAFTLAACLFGSAIVGRIAAQEPSETPAAAPTANSPSSDEIARWIGELSHDAFKVRQSAAARLLAAGMAARDPLLAIADGPDPETRAAARRLVALIDRTEFQRRLLAFAADTDGRLGLRLPGWEKFRELVGGDPPARALFVDMQRQEGALLAAAFGVSSRPPEEIWEPRLMRLVQWQATSGDRNVPPPLGSCAAMLFLGAAADMTVSETGAVLVENLIQRPPLHEAIQEANPQNAIRKLVAGWILHCPNQNEVILARRLALTSNLEMQEALPLALAVSSGDEKYVRVSPATRSTAVLIIGQLGQRKHVDELEPLLDDASICIPPHAQGPGQPIAEVQIRDVALVVMLHLTNQRPADYGYINARLMQPQRLFQLPTLSREKNDERTEAVAKWRAWRAAEKGRESSDEGREPEKEKPTQAD